ncbi:hypothetical protein CK503_01735 [Aliifodinibius salipaludis]|uniref:Uncharacterized protein n=1 Tax=Fodinibius salipaludis TaxID=2032627 RepID=A0A2A2GG18_9BACT|nr:hypothetical protein [Aliifodinibius salipaludis]PAU95805.1 hypothetical protein CK503_01735 [Aliifodinibius salipaludis]
MIKLKLGFVLLSFLLITGCDGPDQHGSAEGGVEIQMVNESDSLSNELSTASDSVDKKMKDLQATLDDINN